MSVMQTAQEQVTEQINEQPIEAGLEEGAAGSDRLTELLAKVPNLSALAATFFTAGPILADTLTMGGNKHV